MKKQQRRLGSGPEKSLITTIRKQVYQKIPGTLLLSILKVSLTRIASYFDDVLIHMIAGRACLYIKSINQSINQSEHMLFQT